VFEGIADRIADHGCGVKICALLLKLDLYDFLGVIPSSSCIGHENGLEEAEHGDGNEIAYEEERLDEGEGERGKENGDEDIEHAQYLRRRFLCRALLRLQIGRAHV